MADPVSSTEVLDVMERPTRIRSDWMVLTGLTEQVMIAVAVIASVVIPKPLDDFSYIG
jgi:hypothetical protein